jgi:hypothetical protein
MSPMFRQNLLYIAGGTMLALLVAFCGGCGGGDGGGGNDPLPVGGLSVNHTTRTLSTIPAEWIATAKTSLHIAYGHTSHGSQLTDGMTALDTWKGGGTYAWAPGGTGGALDLTDYYGSFNGGAAQDLGNPDGSSWATATRAYLNAHPTCNVIIWSWCGEVSSADSAYITNYLNLMTGLENDYPGVRFVYMTGHLDGTGVAGNLNVRNQQIRTYCAANDKILYDFADIESYDPDGNYFLDKGANDACDYSDVTGSHNWATDWQNAHTLGVDWFDCSAAHSQPLNGNLKAYAAWWLWARLAGWSGP